MLFQREFDMSEDSTPNHQEPSHEYLFKYLAGEQAKAIEMLVSGNQSAAMTLSEKNLKAVDEALKTFTNDADFQALKGYTLKDIYQSSKNLLSDKERQAYLRRAHESFNRALELDPNSPSAHNGLGNVLFFQGHYDEAKKETEKAIKLAKGDYPAADHDLNLILKIIQEKAKSIYQQSKGTKVEEIANIVNQEVQTWIISDQEQMKRNADNLFFSLKQKIPDIPMNKNIYDRIENISKETDLVRQYELLPILIASIPQIVIGEMNVNKNIEGDEINISDVKGDVFGVGKHAVGIKINQQQLAKIPDEYNKSLQDFSAAINQQLKTHNIRKEQVASLQDKINELTKEIEDIKNTDDISFAKKTSIKGRLAALAEGTLKILPKTTETLTTFTPLAPLSKLIGEGVEEIVKAIQKDV